MAELERTSKMQLDATVKLYGEINKLQNQEMVAVETHQKRKAALIQQEIAAIAAGDKAKAQSIANEIKGLRQAEDYLTEIEQHYRMQVGLIDHVGAALNSLSDIFGKNAALEIASIVAVAIPKIAMNMGAGLSALAVGDEWAAANYFAAAAEYGLAAGANISSSVGGSKSSSAPSSPSATAPGSTPATTPPTMAPGAISASPGGRVNVVLIHNDSSAAAVITKIVSDGVRYQSLQLNASHNANGRQL